MKLYIYDHCPYCVKARMIFGYLNLPFDLITLPNGDVETPTRMIGKKMVPILELDDETYMPESMDIVHYIDENFSDKSIFTGEKRAEIAGWLEESREYLYPLAMPRWVKMPLEEFADEESKRFYTEKKEAMVGNFKELIANSAPIIDKASKHLKELEKLIKSTQYVNGNLSEDDIHLFAALRSLSCVKGLEFPQKVKEYMKNTAEMTNIPLHFDIAV